MKTKILFLLAAVGLVALTAWFARQNISADHSSKNTLDPVAQGAEPNRAQADEVLEKYRETIRKGLEFLAKNQHKDGHWEGDGGKHPVAMTGLVGLALLMERVAPRHFGGPPEPRRGISYAANISNAADWLIDKSQAKRDGLIFSEHPSETARYMQGHGLATLFLAGVLEQERDGTRRQKLTEVLTRAVKYIVKAQSSQGGWYHTSKAEGHDFDTISATVIQIQALQAAENASIPVPNETISDARQYLKTVLGKSEDMAKPGQPRNSPAETAGALACRSGVLSNGKRVKWEEVHAKWWSHCQSGIPMGRDTKFGRDELGHYYYAQAAYNLDGDIWSAYRTAMFDHLKSNQNKDGSWPAGDGISVGPVYSTALWCIVLQLDNGSHPFMQPPAVVID